MEALAVLRWARRFATGPAAPYIIGRAWKRLMRILTGIANLAPTEAYPMGGYNGVPRLTERVHGTLEANIALFGEGTGAVGVVTIDTVLAGSRLTNRVTEAMRAHHGIAAGNVLVLASHTHFAPMLDGSKPVLGEVSQSAFDLAAQSIESAIASLREMNAVDVRVGSHESDAGVNRRLRWRWPSLVRLLKRVDSDVYMADNPLGPRDPRIRTALWRSARGKPIAAFWSFACHPVGFPERATASADFVGVVREAIRVRYGAALPVLFAPGCMGDIRPRSPRGTGTLPGAIATLAYGPRPRPFDRRSWDAWAEALAADVLSADDSATPESLAGFEPLAGPMARLPLDAIFNGTTAVPALTAKTVRIPGVGPIVALSCEPVTAVADLVRQSDEELVLGYEGDVFGYLPTEAIIAEGGYEATRFMRFFGMEGSWREGTDGRLRAWSSARKAL